MRWNDEKSQTEIDILYINNGTFDELVSGANLRYYSMIEENENIIKSWLPIGLWGDIAPYNYELNPVIISPKSKLIKNYRFGLNNDDIKRINDFNKNNIEVGAYLRFYRVSNDGFTFIRPFRKGTVGMGPFMACFFPDIAIDLNQNFFDRQSLYVKRLESLGSFQNIRSFESVRIMFYDNFSQVKHKLTNKIKDLFSSAYFKISNIKYKIRQRKNK